MLQIRVMPAKGTYPATLTFWLPGLANIPSVEDKPMMGMVYFFFGYVFHKLLFRFERGFRIPGQANPGRYPENMCIHRHGRLFENNGSNNVGCLSTNSGQTLKFFHIRGDYPIKITDEGPGHAQEVLGFIIGV